MRVEDFAQESHRLLLNAVDNMPERNSAIASFVVGYSSKNRGFVKLYKNSKKPTVFRGRSQKVSLPTFPSLGFEHDGNVGIYARSSQIIFDIDTNPNKSVSHTADVVLMLIDLLDLDVKKIFLTLTPSGGAHLYCSVPRGFSRAIMHSNVLDTATIQQWAHMLSRTVNIVDNIHIDVRRAHDKMYVVAPGSSVLVDGKKKFYKAYAHFDCYSELFEDMVEEIISSQKISVEKRPISLSVPHQSPTYVDVFAINENAKLSLTSKDLPRLAVCSQEAYQALVHVLKGELYSKPSQKATHGSQDEQNTKDDKEPKNKKISFDKATQPVLHELATTRKPLCGSSLGNSNVKIVQKIKDLGGIPFENTYVKTGKIRSVRSLANYFKYSPTITLDSVEKVLSYPVNINALYAYILQKRTDDKYVKNHALRAYVIARVSSFLNPLQTASLCHVLGIDKDTYTGKPLAPKSLVKDVLNFEKKNLSSKGDNTQHCSVYLELSYKKPGTKGSKKSVHRERARKMCRSYKKYLVVDYDKAYQALIELGSTPKKAEQCLRVLSVFAGNYARGNHLVLSSRDFIQKMTGLTTSQVHEALRSLRASNILVLEKKQYEKKTSMHSIHRCLISYERSETMQRIRYNSRVNNLVPTELFILLVPNTTGGFTSGFAHESTEGQMVAPMNHLTQEHVDIMLAVAEKGSPILKSLYMKKNPLHKGIALTVSLFYAVKNGDIQAHSRTGIEARYAKNYNFGEHTESYIEAFDGRMYVEDSIQKYISCVSRGETNRQLTHYELLNDNSLDVNNGVMTSTSVDSSSPMIEYVLA